MSELERQTLTRVCVQGLGFVGSAMAAAIASARDDSGAPIYDVVGIDLETSAGLQRVNAINEGIFPFGSTDQTLVDAVAEAKRIGNLRASVDLSAYSEAEVIVVDVHLDVEDRSGIAHCDFSGFEAAIRTIGRQAPSGALVIVETTVPPGTCRNIVLPILAEEMARRGLSESGLAVAHSYERVMPGPNYLDSIRNYWRVYAAENEVAAQRCEAFLRTIVDAERYPLTQLADTVASETAKVLENSYRAVNIAFIEEWGRFAERLGVNLFEVLEAIRMRPTHSNIRQPGLGVGGYCLTKDPLFPEISAVQFLNDPHLAFPFNRLAMKTNKEMPHRSVARLIDGLCDYGGRGVEGARVLMLGAAYRSEVDDTRFSAAESFYFGLRSYGMEVVCYDPLVSAWPETGCEMLRELPSCESFDAIAFCVGHSEFKTIDLVKWLASSRPLVYDCDHCLTDTQTAQLDEMGCPFLSTGRGDHKL